MQLGRGTIARGFGRAGVLLTLVALLTFPVTAQEDPGRKCDREYEDCWRRAATHRDRRKADIDEAAAIAGFAGVAGCAGVCFFAGPGYGVCVAACIAVAGAEVAALRAHDLADVEEEHQKAVDDCIRRRKECLGQ